MEKNNVLKKWKTLLEKIMKKLMKSKIEDPFFNPNYSKLRHALYDFCP